MLPPAIGPVGQTLEGHDLVLVAGSSVFPYYPYIPGPPLPEGAELVAITNDPDEAARAPVGDAIVADVKLTLEALLEAVGESDRPPPEPLGDPPPVEDSDPLDPVGRARHAARGAARRRASSCWSRRPAPWRCATGCASRVPAATTSAPAAASASASAPGVGVQLAQPDRPVVCVLGEGSAQYAISGFWTAAAYKVPVTFLIMRNDEYGILKWFAEAEQVDRRARPRPPGARDREDRRGLRRSASRCAARDELRDALDAAIGADEPRLVEVAVEPGMSLF